MAQSGRQGDALLCCSVWHDLHASLQPTAPARGGGTSLHPECRAPRPLDRRSLSHSSPDLVAVASRDLRAGEMLSLNQASHGVDALEPRLLLPQRMTETGAGASACVPYYLAAGAVMARDVRQGQRLTLADVLVPRDTVLFRLRAHQEALTTEDWLMETKQSAVNATRETTVELAEVSRL